MIRVVQHHSMIYELGENREKLKCKEEPVHCVTYQLPWKKHYQLNFILVNVINRSFLSANSLQVYEMLRVRHKSKQQLCTVTSYCYCYLLTIMLFISLFNILSMMYAVTLFFKQVGHWCLQYKIPITMECRVLHNLLECSKSACNIIPLKFHILATLDKIIHPFNRVFIHYCLCFH